MRMFFYTVDWNSQRVSGGFRAESKKEALALIASWYNYEALVLSIR